MKLKKIISVLLAAVMLISVVSVASFAASVYDKIGDVDFVIPTGYKLSKENFSVKFDFSGSKYAALGGASPAFKVRTNEKIGDVQFATAPDDFIAAFDGSGSKTLCVPFVLDFKSEIVFGTINYTCTVSGFYKAEDEGTENIKYTSFKKTGTVELNSVSRMDGFSSYVTKVNYTDNEKFDPDGLVVILMLSNGAVGSLEYNADTAAVFSFNPTADENLNVNTTSVDISVAGVYAGTTPVTVEHAFSGEYTSISSTRHAHVCEGCGEVIDAQEHTFDNWVSNDNATFLKDCTETGTCTVCGATATRDIEGTAGYVTKLGDYQFLYVIFDYISLLLSTITGAQNK